MTDAVTNERHSEAACFRDPREAVAEAWASIDGKLDDFKGGRCGFDHLGHYSGYMIEAEELISRIERRGWKLVRVE